MCTSGALSWVGRCDSGGAYRDSLRDMEGYPFPMGGVTPGLMKCLFIND